MNTHQRWTAGAALLLAALGCSATAQASVDTSAKPGGVYRLKPGIYLARGASCEAPVNAAIRLYDGRGINTIHDVSCKTRVLARQGNRYTVDQSCTDTRAEPGRRIVQRQRIVVRDALSFTQTARGATKTYRYCVPYQLPTEVRQYLP